MEAGNSLTSVLSFFDRNYVGFRRITIKDSWARGELPSLEIETSDTYGICLYMSTDAFVEFEDGVCRASFAFHFDSPPSEQTDTTSKIRTQGTVTSCRGMIATGFRAKPFEVVLSGETAYRQEKHSIWDCGTVYDEPDGQISENPIVGRH